MHSFASPSTFIGPAIEAGYVMAHPADGFPREWRDGAAAYGRNYGSYLGLHTAGNVTRFAVAAIDHEDPRYFASTHTNPFRRAAHAIAFTLVDRSDSQRSSFAFSNIAGATAAGFTANLWQPDRFNDTSHGVQRSLSELGNYAAQNILHEFAPDLTNIARRFHLARSSSKPDLAVVPPNPESSQP